VSWWRNGGENINVGVSINGGGKSRKKAVKAEASENGWLLRKLAAAGIVKESKRQPFSAASKKYRRRKCQMKWPAQCCPANGESES
jgi:hypothetical protein